MANNKGKCQVCPKFSESRCSWCKMVFYCSKEHQKQDWPHHKETCTKKKYRLEENEQLGRHLVATEDIKADHILFKDKPLVLAYKLDTLEYTRNKICVGCYKEIPYENYQQRAKRDGNGRSKKHEQKTDKKSEKVRSGNNEDDDEKKVDNFEHVSSGEEDDDSDDEDNNTEQVCLSCHMPVCTESCSTQYFHKSFECKLLCEAASYNQQQQMQQNLEPTSATLVLPDPGGTRESGKTHQQHQTPEKKHKNCAPMVETATPLSSPMSTLFGILQERPSSSSNQKLMSPGTTCTNTTPVRGSTPITSKGNGIREALLRNLLYFRCLLLKHVNEGHWNELMSLQSNEESRNDVASLEKTTRIFTLIKKTLAEINHPSMSHVYKPDVHKILGIVEINALNINLSPNVEVTGIWGAPFSMMEHSCIPSVKYYLVPCVSEKKSKSTFFELYCRSAVKLKTGDHLSMTYTNAMWNTDKRREFLQKERKFWCNCTRCVDPWELGSNFSTLLCPFCKSTSVPVPKEAAGNSHEIQWKCTDTKCGKTCASWQVKKVDMKLCEMVGNTKPSIENYKECLQKMQELVHPDYYLCCIITHSLVQMFGHDAASVHDKPLLEEKIGLCNKLLGIIKKLDGGASLSLLNIYASIVYYEIHSAILAMAGAEVDDDYLILRNNKESVKLAKMYLQKCIDCFKYEFIEIPEHKLKVLAAKKLEYLNLVMNKR